MSDPDRDAGNIWSLTSDNDVNPGSRFNFNDQPWTQIAIGSGLGLRADLEFFVFRLDVGTIPKLLVYIACNYSHNLNPHPLQQPKLPIPKTPSTQRSYLPR